ncbi:MAG: phosphotransferase [Rhodobacteraceae bacterium]|nr:phosphotransferase [Paracoccaceae bacterium]
MPDIDTGNVELCLRRVLPGVRVHAVERFSSGQSNPTYLIKTDRRKFVLRSKPPGNLLPSAHLVEREYQVMRALKHTRVPVPEMLLLETDISSPTGRAFLVMEHVEGEVLFDPALPRMNAQRRAGIYRQMNQLLAELHKLDADEIGLSGFGRRQGYFSRQTHIWSRQYRGSRLTPNRDMETLITWLNSNMREFGDEVRLVHGDFRLDNIIFERSGNTAVALIDWELATLGHPFADLAYQCAQWRMPHSCPLPGLGGLDRRQLGLPGEEEFVTDYCRHRGIGPPDEWNFCLAFALFKLAAILEGVARRAVEGNASNPEMAKQYGTMVPTLAELALEIAETA